MIVLRQVDNFQSFGDVISCRLSGQHLDFTAVTTNVFKKLSLRHRTSVFKIKSERPIFSLPNSESHTRTYHVNKARVYDNSQHYLHLELCGEMWIVVHQPFVIIYIKSYQNPLIRICWCVIFLSYKTYSMILHIRVPLVCVRSSFRTKKKTSTIVQTQNQKPFLVVYIHQYHTNRTKLYS